MHNTKKSNKMIPCIHLHICNAKRFKPPKSLKDENNSTSLLKQHANIISLNKARLHGLSLHCYKRCHLVETLRSHMQRPAFSRRYPIIMEILNIFAVIYEREYQPWQEWLWVRRWWNGNDGGIQDDKPYNDAFLWKRNWPSRKYIKLQSRWISISKMWQSFRNRRG